MDNFEILHLNPHLIDFIPGKELDDVIRWMENNPEKVQGLLELIEN
jgi:hypothetical protein